MKAVVTFEDEGDQVKISVDFGEQGAQETSAAHQGAVMSIHLFQQHVKIMGGLGDGQQLPTH
jgi:hypothetical protein